MSWNSTFGAEVYDRFVREHGLYRRLNAWLVRRSGLENAKRVLDLACGTGATTLGCLEVMDARTESIGVDASEAMIRIARAHVLDPRARFQVAEAGQVDRALSPAFDRVLCNAAFWEFPDRERVFAAVARLLVPGGRLVFNVPADRIRGADAPIHPFQITLGLELQRRDPAQPLAPPRALVLPQLVQSAAASGLILQRHERTILSCRQGELMELMTIPPLIRPLTPALSDGERAALLERASRHVDPDEEVQIPWHLLSFQTLESAAFPAVLDQPETPNHETGEPPCDTLTS